MSTGIFMYLEKNLAIILKLCYNYHIVTNTNFEEEYSYGNFFYTIY